MTCEEFDQLVTDMHDDYYEQASAEASACHVAACPRCAERVAAEARVTQALRALADADRHREAPAHVEVMARAVWRGAAVAHASARMAPTPATSAIAWWRPAAAAAVIAIAVTGVGVSMWSRPTGRQSPGQREGEAASSASIESSAASAPRVPAASTSAANATGVVEGEPPPRPLGVTARESTRTPLASRGVRRTTGAASASRTANAASTPASTASAASRARAESLAFVPLPYAEPLRPTEVRQIVRVAVPQTTLLMAGLTASTPAESVVADVLVGEDGIARGIRIVRE